MIRRLHTKDSFILFSIFTLIVITILCITSYYQVPASPKPQSNQSDVLDALQKDLDSTQKKLADTQKELEDTYSMLDQTESGLNDANEQIARQEEKIDGLSKQIELLKNGGKELPSANKVAYLTFDDGPSENTLPILAILESYNVHATFFVINTKYSDYMKNIVEKGHTIAIHSYSHDYEKIYKTDKAFLKDLQLIHDQVLEITGVDSRIMRFPGGTSNLVSKKYNKKDGIMTRLSKKVVEKGYIYFDWNCDSGDADADVTKWKSIVDNVKEGVRDKDSAIILMHDSPSKTSTIQALPLIIEYLQSEGFELRAITEDTELVQHGVQN